MLEVTLKYRAVYDDMTASKENGMHQFELSDEEWDTAHQLRKVLKVFKHATLFFSRGTPNLVQVIPAMDHVDKVLSTVSASAKYSEPIQVACGIAKKALNRYYSYTDMSAMYRIAMILHPSHKLHYFKKMRWPEAWRTTAKELLVEKYKHSYEGRYADEDEEDDDDNIGDTRTASRSSRRSSWASFDEDDDGGPSPSELNDDDDGDGGAQTDSSEVSPRLSSHWQPT
ncbi:hypothetical protein LXA43DRAFT_893091 [Ganoderma leucocontextum]|nr:hypothetical protein LXA43DRAFT_893091 [Ganoderma leucocontextum]